MFGLARLLREVLSLGFRVHGVQRFRVLRPKVLKEKNSEVLEPTGDLQVGDDALGNSIVEGHSAATNLEVRG